MSKGPFTLSVSDVARNIVPMFTDFLIHQASHSKKEFQIQIDLSASVVTALTLVLSVKVSSCVMDTFLQMLIPKNLEHPLKIYFKHSWKICGKGLSCVKNQLLTSTCFSKAFNYCENFAQSAPNIGSAVTLAKLLVTIATQTEDPALETKIGKRRGAL